MSLFLAPLPIQGSKLTTAAIDPTMGFVTDRSPLNLPPGFTPRSENFILREGAIEPRPMLVQYGANANPMKVAVTGGREIIDVAGTRYPFISGTTRMAYHTGTQWSVLSYVSAYGVNAPPAGTATDYWDITQVYWPDTDQNLAVAANSSYQSLYVWKSGTSVFSSMTGAPRALRVCAFDNYLMTLNQTDDNAGGQLVQRVQWSDRGSASSWTGGLSGFEDLLDMRGYGTRLWPQESRVLVFSDQEIWQAVTGAGPFVFQFVPLDRTVGCPYPWTICDTPLGVAFLGRDLQVWVVPRGGGMPTPMSRTIHRELRTTISRSERAWAVYDPASQQYQLYYAVLGGSGTPQRALYVDVGTGAWQPQSFDRVGGQQSVTFGFLGTVSSSATTWGGAHAAGLTWATAGSRTWGQMSGTSEQRSVLVGSSAGTMWQLAESATNDDGVSVPCKHQTVIGADDPFRTKTLMRVTLDVDAPSASSCTVRVSQSLGASFEAGVGVNLPAGLNQANADVYLGARYPVVEVQVEGSKPRIQRLYASYRPGGR